MEDDMSISAVVPIYKDNDHHPLRAKTVDANNRLQMYDQLINQEISTNRQDLTICYFCFMSIFCYFKNYYEYEGETYERNYSCRRFRHAALSAYSRYI